MVEKAPPPGKTSGQATVETAQPDNEAWRPKDYSDLQLNTNPFERFNFSADPVVEEVSREDGAPLQSSKDVSG